MGEQAARRAAETQRSERKAKMCRACDDPIDERTGTKTGDYCQECFDEITKGAIPDVMGPTLQSHASHLTYRQAMKLGKTDG